MFRKYRNVILMVVFLLASSSYKVLLALAFPKLGTYPAKLLEETLQAATVLAFITGGKLWRRVGSLKGKNPKSLLCLIPIAILSFLPIFGGVEGNRASDILFLVVITLLIGVSEELSCRGVILAELAQLGRFQSIVLSSILFGILHFINLIKGAGFVETVLQVIFATGFGLTMAVVRRRSGAILPLIVTHALWDFNSKMSGDSKSVVLNTAIWISIAAVVLWGVYLAAIEWRSAKNMENIGISKDEAVRV